MEEIKPDILTALLVKRNFQDAMRVAVDDLKQTQNYEPFLDLATEDKALVLVTIDDRNKIHFHKVEPETQLPKTTVSLEKPILVESPLEPVEPEPANFSKAEKPKPRKVRST